MKTQNLIPFGLIGLASLGLLLAIPKSESATLGSGFGWDGVDFQQPGNHPPQHFGIDANFPTLDYKGNHLKNYPPHDEMEGAQTTRKVEVPIATTGRNYEVDCGEFENQAEPSRPALDSHFSREHVTYYKFHVCYWANSLDYWSSKIEQATHEGEKEEFENAQDIAGMMLKTAKAGLAATIQERLYAGPIPIR